MTELPEPDIASIAPPDPNTKAGPFQLVMNKNWKSDIAKNAGVIERMAKVGDEMVKESQAIAPVGNSGNLQGAIYSRVIQGRGPAGQFLAAQLEFGCDVEYALPVEFGHHVEGGDFVPARPFMRPVAMKRRSLG